MPQSAGPVARPRNGYGLITLAIVGALVAATGTPDAETFASLIDVGVPETIARTGMYVVPVLFIVLALALGRALGRGRSPVIRWSLYAGFGAIAGFVLGLCLEVFAGVPNIIAALTGPLAEATLLDTFLWILGVLCFLMGVMVGVIAIFGQPAVSALQVEEVSDHECLEVRRAERGVFGWSGFGMLTLGLACCALAVTRQADEAVRLAPMVIAIGSGVVSVFANYVLWRGFDEMQRRHVVDGYASSAIVVTLGAFVWAALEALGYAEPLSATGVFLALTFVQLIAVSYVTTSVMGQLNMFGKPA